jgi:hypothetical protein
MINCNKCNGSGTRIIGERDGDSFWNRCIPCDCQSDTQIPVRSAIFDELLTACEVVLACETHHDDNGAYLRVPASSIFDLGAEIRGVVNAARQPNVQA